MSPSPSQPTPTKASSGGSVQWGFSPLSMALAFPAKLCAFLLQLSEELTKGEMQPCRSNILIIYCSVAHVTGHYHLERSSGPEEELSFSLWRTVLFNLIFLLSSHVISHGFRYVGREEWGGGGKWQILHFFVGIWAFKMWSFLLNVVIWYILFMLLTHRGINLNSMGSYLWLQLLLDH